MERQEFSKNQNNMKLIDLRHSIRERRKELRMTSKSLAEAAKTTQSNVLNFENGKANITLNTLGNILDALGLEIKLANKNNNG